jgi:hypothetical protein
MTKAEKILQWVLAAIIVAIFIVALVSCAPMQDALVPDTMELSFQRGTIDAMDEWADDQRTVSLGVAFTWDLRKDVRNEIRLLRRAIVSRDCSQD